MARCSAAIIGSVLGFLLGVYLAFIFGFHEQRHVFPLAITMGTVAGAFGLEASSWFLASLSGRHHFPAMLLLVISAIAALFLFVQIIT